MNFGLSFLASEYSQLPADVMAVEAVLFDRSNLDTHCWEEAWKNIGAAAQQRGGDNVSFHFPVNDADYVCDISVRKKLSEAYNRSCDLGLRGVVVHANRLADIETWSRRDIKAERTRVLDVLDAIAQRRQSTWLAVENMPVMDNDGAVIDPCFVYPHDFDILRTTSVRCVFDVCHYFCTVATIAEVTAGLQPAHGYPVIRETGFFDFVDVAPLIVHWHFSAFAGIPRLGLVDGCREGVLPHQGSLSADLYAQALKRMAQISPQGRCIFEVREVDYSRRLAGPDIIYWANMLLGQNKGTPCQS